MIYRRKTGIKDPMKFKTTFFLSKHLLNVCLSCLETEFQRKTKKILVSIKKEHGYIYFNIKKMLHCAPYERCSLFLDTFFVPLEDVKLRQLTRRRRLHDNAMLSNYF